MSDSSAPTRRADPRRAAFEVLQRLDRGPVDLQAALDGAFSKGSWDRRDKGFATALTMGVAQWRQRIDPYIKTLTGRRVKDLDRRARTVLRLGIYQLHYLERVPDSAAVDQSVRLCGNDARLKRFVNGVLRTAARDGAAPAIEITDAASLAREAALPTWLAQRWWRQYGRDGAIAWGEQVNASAPLTVRVNSAKIATADYVGQLEHAGMTVQPSAWIDGALRVSGPLPVAHFPGYADGLFYVQDEASQWVAQLLDAQPGDRVLDACAAPGGKATQLAATVGAGGQVVALELDAGRAKRLKANLSRLGCDNVATVEGDAGALTADALGGLFERVLLDAPCSGLGVLHRHPEGKWWKSESGIDACCAAQQTLLEHLSTLLKPGGHLVYAVCSGEPQEGVRQITRFLAQHPEFSVASALDVLGDAARPWVTPEGFLDTAGNRAGMDAFFAVHLVKKT